LFVGLNFIFNQEMEKYFCKCSFDVAIQINFIVLL